MAVCALYSPDLHVYSHSQAKKIPKTHSEIFKFGGILLRLKYLILFANVISLNFDQDLAVEVMIGNGIYEGYELPDLNIAFWGKWGIVN